MTNSVGVYPAADVRPAGEQVSSGYEGRQLTFTEEELKHPAEDNGFVTKGDPVIFCLAGDESSFGIGVGVAMIGNSHLSGRAVTDLISVDTEGIFIQNVVATDDDGNSAVIPGDQIFIDVDTCILSKISSTVTNLPFGYALGRVAGGSDGDIAVKVHFDPPDNWIVFDEKLFFGDAKEAWLTPTGDKGYDGILAYAEWTVAGQTGRPFESQMLNNVLLGGYANALKGYMDCDESGGSTGLLSGINGEIRLPDAAGAGAYFALEGEVVFQTSTTINPYGSTAGFLHLGITPAGAGSADFQDDGVFMSVWGLTNEVGHMLSLDYHTLRCDFYIAAHFTKYLVLSLAENYIYHEFSDLDAGGRMLRLSGTWQTPNTGDGEGLVNIQVAIQGGATGHTNLCSAWFNLGASCILPSYTTLHSDGYHDGGTADLSTAKIAWAKYGCHLVDDPQWNYLWELNMSGAGCAVDCLFNVNDEGDALGVIVGDHPDDTPYGSIPFYSVAGGTAKYVRVYSGIA